MRSRYLIETFIFFALMVFFQYSVSQFNKDLHVSINENNTFKALEVEIQARGGLSYPERSRSSEHVTNIEHDHDESGSNLLRRVLSGSGEPLDLSTLTLGEIQHEEEVLHEVLVH